MRILVDIYHDIKTEARTQDLVRIMSKIGDTSFVSYSFNDIVPNVKTYLTGKGIRKYYTFVLDSIKYIKRLKPDVLVLHDNYCSIILFFCIIFLRKRPYIIYDSSELYYDKKPKNLKGMCAHIMQLFENRFIRKADLVIAANIERAELMKEVFGLNDTPLVLDNIHRIEDEYSLADCNTKFGKYLNDESFKILYAGGVSRERKTFDIAKAVSEIDHSITFIVVGAGRGESIEEFDDYIKQLKLEESVYYLGFVSRAELKYLLNMCDISISMFEQNCYNNTFCASGKVYESLFENTPVLLSTNPPLKRLCEEHKVGVSTDDITAGIIELEENIKMYKNNTKNYIAKIDYENRINRYAETLECIIMRDYSLKRKKNND